MDYIFIIIFIVIFVLPWIKKAKKTNAKKSKNWGQTDEQIRNKYGHSGAKNATHKRLHSKDTSSAFPETHQERVRKRDLHDRLELRKMENTIHSRKNAGIIRAGNKGRDDWGARGDKTSFTGLFVFIFFAVILYIIAADILPKYF